MDKRDRFWQWFVAHQGELEHIRERQQDLYPQVVRAIRAVNPGLVCDFEVSPDGSEKKVVISADGNQALFPMVIRLVDEAPRALLPGWQVVAFRQPRLAHFNLQFADMALSSDQIMVAYQRQSGGNKLDVTLYIQDWESGISGMAAAGLVILDNAIGEYTTATRIGQVVIKPLELTQTRRDTLVPLIRFYRVVNELFGQS